MTPLEKAVRAGSRSLSAMGDTYRELHGKSNSKKADGWIRDLPYNVYKAFGKAAGKFQVLPILFPFAVLDEDAEDDDDD